MKKHEKLTAFLFCAVIAVFSIAFIFSPARDFSEQENRELAQAPRLDAGDVFDGTFAENTNVWFADQFPARDALVNIKALTEQAMLKQSNNGVLYTYGQLAVKQFDAYRSVLYSLDDADGFFESTVSAQLDNYSRVIGNIGLPAVTLIPPRTIDVAGGIFGYPGHGDDLFSLVEAKLDEQTGYVDLLTSERDAFEEGEYVIYRTDHHWTILGAYKAYCRVLNALGDGDEIISESAFEKQKTDGFSGTTAAKGNFPFYEKDVLELWLYGDEDEYDISFDGVSADSFYNFGYLEKSDKYSVFLDGTHAIAEISKPGVERKKLLILKDSFANSLIPFLARNYDIVAVDIKSGYSLTEYAERYAPDAILVVCNAENLVSNGTFGKIY